MKESFCLEMSHATFVKKCLNDTDFLIQVYRFMKMIASDIITP